MPELPEVEVTRRALGAIAGLRIDGVHLGKPLRWPLGIEPDVLVGRRIQALDRRGKYLLLHLSQGIVLIHLGMSGSLALRARNPAHRPILSLHEHLLLSLGAVEVRLHDPRRFGAVVYSETLQSLPASKLLSTIGPEPLGADFMPRQFFKALKLLKSPIKQVLLAGKLVCGVGNIYASEALFHAGIRPTRKAAKLTQADALRLHEAIVKVLEAAVEAGGSSLRDFVQPDGSSGHFQTASQVYGRKGEPCFRCQAPIRHTVQGQRSSYYCANCQK